MNYLNEKERLRKLMDEKPMAASEVSRIVGLSDFTIYRFLKHDLGVSKKTMRILRDFLKENGY